MVVSAKENVRVFGHKIILGILEEIEKYIASVHQLDELRTRFLDLGGDLLEIHQDGLRNYQQVVQERKKEWFGRIIITHYINEQDRFNWESTEMVEVGKKVKVSFNVASFCGNVDEHQKLELISSVDGKRLEKVQYRLSKTFDRFTKDEENIILHQVLVRLKDNQIYQVKIERNIDTPPSERGSYYHHPAKAIIKHEVCL